MTPAEHLARAEQLLADVELSATGGFTDRQWVNVETAVAHALIAAAAELGVPHAGITTGGETGAAVQGGS